MLPVSYSRTQLWRRPAVMVKNCPSVGMSDSWLWSSSPQQCIFRLLSIKQEATSEAVITSEQISGGDGGNAKKKDGGEIFGKCKHED